MGESESFVINNYFIKNIDLSDWNTEEIIKRSKMLLLVVDKIWSLNNYKEIDLIKHQDPSIDDHSCQQVANIIISWLGDKKITFDLLCIALNSYLVQGKSPSYIDANIFGIQDTNGLVFKTIIDFLGVKN